jgi:excisionase family DNA binding protein
MSEAQIARATRAHRATVAASLERRETPDGLHAQVQAELSVAAAIPDSQSPSASSALAMTTGTSIDVMAELGILEPHEVSELLRLRHSTVLDLSRRGVLPAFKIGKQRRYRRADLEGWMVRQRHAT